MPKRGQKSINPTTGDTYEFLDTAVDTKGEFVRLKATIQSKGQLVPDHYHLLQDETFEVISGKLTFCYNKQTKVISAGEKIIFPKGLRHNHYNNEDSELTYIQTVSPALDFDYLIENLVGLAADGKCKNGRYGLFQELVTLKYLDSKSYMADIPQRVQNILMSIMDPIGRLLGYRAIYKKYSGVEK